MGVCYQGIHLLLHHLHSQGRAELREDATHLSHPDPKTELQSSSPPASFLPSLSPLQISFPNFPAGKLVRPLPLQHQGDASGVMPWELGAMPAPSTSAQSALILPGLPPRHGTRDKSSQWQAIADASPKSSPQRPGWWETAELASLGTVLEMCPQQRWSTVLLWSLHLAGRGFPRSNPALGGFVTCRFKEPCGALSRAAACHGQEWAV